MMSHHQKSPQKKLPRKFPWLWCWEIPLVMILVITESYLKLYWNMTHKIPLVIEASYGYVQHDLKPVAMMVIMVMLWWLWWLYGYTKSPGLGDESSSKVVLFENRRSLFRRMPGQQFWNDESALLWKCQISKKCAFWNPHVKSFILMGHKQWVLNLHIWNLICIFGT